MKRKRRDDLTDPLRYICMEVPWNWTVIQGIRPESFEDTPKEMTEEQYRAADMKARRGEMSDFDTAERQLNAEFEEINELYGGNG